MPKTKDAFALRGFDCDKYLQTKLKDCGLSATALQELDADKNNFDDLQRARKSYDRLDEDIKAFGRKLNAHCNRIQKYNMRLTNKLSKINDDNLYLSMSKIRGKRLTYLIDNYMAITQYFLDVRETICDIVYKLDQYQRNYYTKIFAARLKQARKAARLTQEELAAQIGLKRSSYGLYEQARNEPNVSVLAILSKILKRPADWFLGLTP